MGEGRGTQAPAALQVGQPEEHSLACGLPSSRSSLPQPAITAATAEEHQPEVSQQLATHREAIQRYIRGIVRDAAVAEDLTQGTLLRAHQKLATLEDPASLDSWLYRIATNICRDRFRRSSPRDRIRSLDEETAGDPERGPLPALTDAGPRLDKVMEQKEMSVCVQRYLPDLPDSYRAVILLHDATGMTNPEIAEMLGVSLATMKIRVHRAREKLGAALREACSLSADDRGVLVCEPIPPDTKDLRLSALDPVIRCAMATADPVGGVSLFVPISSIALRGSS
jgi:RNA polymerase sigma-70 factor (ECF subfamily)